VILDKLRELKSQFRIQEVGFDEWNATYLVQDLERAGFVVSPHRQGFKSMSAPLKELQDLVLNGRLIHNGNEILDWMAGNLIAKEDDAGNVKPTKRNRAAKIDGMVALVMALGTHMRNRGPKLVSALKGFDV
jgi:phage terminase large subunit-like protein